MNVIKLVEKDYERSDIPEFREGDTVRVHVKIKEGNRERTQVFEGFVLKIQNGGINKTFTVRRIASGVGVEKTFPVSSPLLEKVEVVQRGHVRRAVVPRLPAAPSAGPEQLLWLIHQPVGWRYGPAWQPFQPVLFFPGPV